MAYILSCCSAVDLTRELLDKNNISCLLMHYTVNGQERLDDLGQSRPIHAFYDDLRSGADVRTSQVNVAEYLSYYTGFLSKGLDVLHITLSSGISGTYNSARNAAAIASEQFPDRKVLVVDSLGASSGYGLLVMKLAALRDQGLSLEELRDWAEANKRKLQHWFFSSDLTFYIKGGRISKAAGIFGGILGICPLMHMDHVGRLIPVAKIRGRARVLRETAKRMEQLAENGPAYAEDCYISHSDCPEDARELADMLEAAFPRLHGRVKLLEIGSVVGAHSGPGTVALYFWGSERIEAQA